MSDGGVSECTGTILIIIVLLIFTGSVSVYVMGVAGDSIPTDYTPQYSIVEAEVIPALSAEDEWDSNSIKITFKFGNELDLSYVEDDYTGTEGIKFMLCEPDGTFHEAMQSITMKGQKIQQGDVFYFFYAPQATYDYYITNQYARVGDDTNWGKGWVYLTPFESGTWRVVIKDDTLHSIIADEEVIIS